MTNCIFVGLHAGEFVTDANELVIIGDNITSAPDGVKLIIGETVNGKKLDVSKVLAWLKRLAVDKEDALSNLDIFENIASKNGVGIGCPAGKCVGGDNRTLGYNTDTSSVVIGYAEIGHHEGGRI